MKIRLWSDIHLEFGDMRFTERDDDNETVLVIAGDFHVGMRSEEFLRKLCARFKAVVYVPGNHEYYGQVIQHFDQDMTNLSFEIGNLHFLNPGIAYIDGVRFIGATLWTDLKGADPVIMQVAKFSMNDYRRIKYIYGEEKNEYYPVSPNVIVELNKAHRKYICDELEKFHLGTTVVVSHHPPHEECCKGKFYYDPSDPLQYCYQNMGLDNWIEMADYWFHGHIHEWSHVNIGKCQVIAKPRGYIGHQNCALQYDLTSKDAEIIEV